MKPPKEAALEYLASIEVHDAYPAGVLVELSGEFDVSCLEAFGHALKRASSFGRPTFVDLSGVTFMDALCVGEPANRSVGPEAPDRHHRAREDRDEAE